MARCDACGGPIEAGTRNHPACLRKIFGRTSLPRVELGLPEISIRAQEAAGRLSISGVQPKLSMIVKRGALEPVASGGRLILKPQTGTFPSLPENENLCMSIAQVLHITVPPNTIVTLGDGSLAYVVRRFDRGDRGEKRHCEDFSQILGADKYSGSIERVARELRKISAVPGLDLQYLFERTLLFFLLGNGDAHLKNISVLHDDDGEVALAPAYDIVSSRLVLPGEEDMALSINGKRNGIDREDLRSFADYCGIPDRVRDDALERFVGAAELIAELVEDSYLDARAREGFIEIVHSRIARLRV